MDRWIELRSFGTPNGFFMEAFGGKGLGLHAGGEGLPLVYFRRPKCVNRNLTPPK